MKNKTMFVLFHAQLFQLLTFNTSKCAVVINHMESKWTMEFVSQQLKKVNQLSVVEVK